MLGSLWFCAKSHVICTVHRHRARMEKAFPKQGSFAHLPAQHTSSAEAPRPLPADNGAAGKGYRKNNTRSTRWLKICAVPWNYIQCINTTSPSPLGSPGKQATRWTIPVVSLLQALLHYHAKASPILPPSPGYLGSGEAGSQAQPHAAWPPFGKGKSAAWPQPWGTDRSLAFRHVAPITKAKNWAQLIIALPQQFLAQSQVLQLRREGGKNRVQSEPA